MTPQQPKFHMIGISGRTKDELAKSMGIDNTCKTLYMPCWVESADETHVTVLLGSEPHVTSKAVKIDRKDIQMLYSSEEGGN
jgi:hypothetical protein